VVVLANAAELEQFKQKCREVGRERHVHILGTRVLTVKETAYPPPPPPKGLFNFLDTLLCAWTVQWRYSGTVYRYDALYELPLPSPVLILKSTLTA
jgi:hypothetical protein